tara:strand:+ start:37041 stop:39635 length:2595 start_codon:yes stop_codon:yes gene_type:complete
MKNTFCVYFSVAFILFSLKSSLLQAQSISPKQKIKAERLSSDSDIQIDGILNEQAWNSAQIATGFIQNFPKDGGTPSERTEVKVLYSDKYLYVGAFAFDSSPDSIAATLFRRDGDEYSDWFFVSIDSYNDNRTAFTFGLNPRGVQKDILYFNDVEEDILWDAVWDSETSINEKGWIAEFRIPLSQLRFTSSNTEQTWGINFERQIARHDEINYWSRVPREEYGEVSWFGDLLNVRDLTKPLRLEIVPYVSSELTREPDLYDGNPFYEKNDLAFKAGGDFKYGITSDFTLTGTINPDFGQVEADPATINLTAFEIFFDEQRPFFLEGADIFAFGKTTSQNTFSTHSNFYSRRIGKSPFGDASYSGISSDFVDAPLETTIAGAAKVSGKTEKGFSLGILNAYTLEEQSSYSFFDGTNTNKGEFIIEPATNYLVTRVRKDLKDGDAQLGGFLSTVNRNSSGSYLERYLNDSAYQLGVDGHYYWANRNWGASGVFAVSQVNGTENSILQTQTSSARFYNRTDSDYLSLDSTKTSLEGYFGEFSLGKYSGSGLRYSFTYSEMSPGYEINDIGFQERADYRSPHLYAEYLNVSSNLFRVYLLWVYSGYAWNFDGDMIMNFYSSGSYFQFNNLWTVIATAGFTGKFYNDRITRGGPLMRRPRDWNSSLELTSNATKSFYAKVGSRYRRDTSGEYTTTLYTSLNYRPTSYIQLEFSPTYIKEKNTDQFQDYDNYDADPDLDYLFSDSYLDIFYTDVRVDWTFTSKLSLQTYIRPLLYTGDFTNFKIFEDPKSYNFNYLGETDSQDFNYKTVQGNAVLRWEYRPGSTFYFVWQQEKERTIYNDTFDLFGGTRDIFKEDPINIFLIKFSYWFGS